MVACQIGMMRSGRLLAEESPKNLLRTSRRPSLEDAFLKLCMDEINDRDDQSSDIEHHPSSSNGDNQNPENLDNITCDSSSNQVDIPGTHTGHERQRNLQGSVTSLADTSDVRMASLFTIIGTNLMMMEKFYYNVWSSSLNVIPFSIKNQFRVLHHTSE